MAERYHPLDSGYIITSPYGWRAFDNAVHRGIDFGFNGGSAGKAVYAIQGGTVLYAGAASGYGGPDPAGWVVIDSDDSQGSGVFEYGHIVRDSYIKPGVKVQAGQKIGNINPDSKTNGGTAPHLHISYMPYEYNPSKKKDFRSLLTGLKNPPRPTSPAPVPTPETQKENNVSNAKDVRTQLRGPSDNGWPQLAPQPDEQGNTWSAALKRNVKAQSLVDGVATLISEATIRIARASRGYADYKSRKGDTVAGNAANAAAIAAENQDILKDLQRRIAALEQK